MSLRDVEVDAVEDGFARHVRVAGAVHLDGEAVGGGGAASRVCRAGGQVGDADDAAGGDHGRLGVVEPAQQGVEGVEQPVEVQGGGARGADGDRVGADEEEAGGEDGGEAEQFAAVEAPEEAGAEQAEA